MTKLQFKKYKKEVPLGEKMTALFSSTHTLYILCLFVCMFRHAQLAQEEIRSVKFKRTRNILVNTSTLSRPRRAPTLNSASCTKLANLWQAVVEMLTGPVSLKAVKLTLLFFFPPKLSIISVIAVYGSVIALL